MVEYQRYKHPRQTGDNYAKKDAIAQKERGLMRTRKEEPEPRQSWDLEPNQSDLDDPFSKNFWSHRRRFLNPRSTVTIESMASTENELETINTSVSEAQEQPTANEGGLEPSKLSLPERFQSPYQVNDNPAGPNVPAQPTISRPISNEGRQSLKLPVP